MTHQDETQGLPSASAGEQFANCPGCFQLEALAPAESPSVEAQQGSEIAKALESDDFTKLDDDGRTIAENLRKQRQEALDDWQKEFDEPTATLDLYVEERFWIRYSHGPRACSAKPDFAAIGRKAALVIDDKTGYLYVTPAYRNYQSRIQALAVRMEFPRLESARAVMSSYRFRGRVDPVDYDGDALAAALRELMHNLWRTQQPFAPRVPGPWCRYCKAKALCPEFANYATMPLVHTGSTPLKPDDAAAIAYRLDLPQLAYVRQRRAMLFAFMEAVDYALQKRSDDELASVGLRRVPTGNIPVCDDVNKLWSAIHASGLMTDAEFRSYLKPVLGKIEDALAEKIKESTECTSKVAQASAKKIMSPAVELKPKAPTLKPIKGE